MHAIALENTRDISGKNVGQSIDEKWTTLQCVLSKEGSTDRPSVRA